MYTHMYIHRCLLMYAYLFTYLFVGREILCTSALWKLLLTSETANGARVAAGLLHTASSGWWWWWWWRWRWWWWCKFAAPKTAGVHSTECAVFLDVGTLISNLWNNIFQDVRLLSSLNVKRPESSNGRG